MAESTLSLTYDELRSRVGKRLGYTRTSTNWTTEEGEEVTQYIRDGLRKFYRAREWNFLRPYRSLDTAISQEAYEIPDYVGYIEGNLFFDSDNPYPEIVKVDPEEIERRRFDVAGTAVPVLYAMRPTMSDNVIGQRNEIVLSPVPSQVWTLTYRARILPDMLSTDKQYALGGSHHSQTILEACLSAVELGSEDTIGGHQAAYESELARSIEYDAKAFMPRSLGYNGNARRTGRHKVRPTLEIEFDQ